MAQLFRNNAFSTLGATLSNVATSLTVATGHGDRFPAVTAPDFCMLTLQDASNNIEIIKVTARTSGADSMTIERAQEGTTARAWAIGDVVELRVTASALNPLGLLEGAATAAAIRTALVVPTRTGGDASGTWGISITGNAGTVTNGVYTTGDQTIAGTKTFSSPISGSVTGNAGTVTNGVYTTGDQTIGGVKTFSSPPVLPGVNGGQLAGLRNKMINGKMEIAQRGTSFPAIVNNTYTLDRWLCAYVSSVVGTVSQQADVPSDNEFQSSLRFAVTTADTSIAAGDYFVLSQTVEGFNARDLIGRTFTLSFWVRSSKTGIHCVRFCNGGFDRTYVAEYTVNAANTWEKKTVTVSGGLITAGTWNWTNGKGLVVDWALAAGTTFHTTAGAWQTGSLISTSSQVNVLDTIGNIFAITGVQLEVGSVATPFEHRPYGLELTLCQRYYYRTVNSGGIATIAAGGQVLSATVSRVFMPLPVPMRITPTAIETTGTATDYVWGVGAGYNAVPVFSNITSNLLVALDGTSSGLTSGQAAFLRQNAAGSYVAVSAEL